MEPLEPRILLSADPIAASILGDPGNATQLLDSFDSAPPGDGVDDLLYADPYFDSDPDDIAAGMVGRVSLVSGADGSEIWSVQGVNQDDYFGWSVTSIGDVNQDGVDDVAIGSPGFKDPGGDFSGRVQIFSGDAPVTGLHTPLLTINPLTLMADGEEFYGDFYDTSVTPAVRDFDWQMFGFSLEWAEDELGQGRSYLAVGDPLATSTDSSGEHDAAHGAVKILSLGWLQDQFLASSASAPSAQVDILKGTPGSRFGWTVESVGTVFDSSAGDGLSDLLVGSPGAAGGVGHLYGVDLDRVGDFNSGDVEAWSSGAEKILLKGSTDYEVGVSALHLIDSNASDQYIIGAPFVPVSEASAPQSGVVFALSDAGLTALYSAGQEAGANAGSAEGIPEYSGATATSLVAAGSVNWAYEVTTDLRFSHKDVGRYLAAGGEWGDEDGSFQDVLDDVLVGVPEFDTAVQYFVEDPDGEYIEGASPGEFEVDPNAGTANASTNAHYSLAGDLIDGGGKILVLSGDTGSELDRLEGLSELEPVAGSTSGFYVGENLGRAMLGGLSLDGSGGRDFVTASLAKPAEAGAADASHYQFDRRRGGSSDLDEAVEEFTDGLAYVREWFEVLFALGEMAVELPFLEDHAAFQGGLGEVFGIFEQLDTNILTPMLSTLDSVSDGTVTPLGFQGLGQLLADSVGQTGDDISDDTVVGADSTLINFSASSTNFSQDDDSGLNNIFGDEAGESEAFIALDLRLQLHLEIAGLDLSFDSTEILPGLTFSTSGDLTLGGDIFIDFGLGYNLDPAVGGFTIGNTFQGDEDGELVNLESHDASQYETVLLWDEDAATTNGYPDDQATEPLHISGSEGFTSYPFTIASQTKYKATLIPLDVSGDPLPVTGGVYEEITYDTVGAYDAGVGGYLLQGVIRDGTDYYSAVAGIDSFKIVPVGYEAASLATVDEAGTTHFEIPGSAEGFEEFGVDGTYYAKVVAVETATGDLHPSEPTGGWEVISYTGLQAQASNNRLDGLERAANDSTEQLLTSGPFTDAGYEARLVPLEEGDAPTLSRNASDHPTAPDVLEPQGLMKVTALLSGDLGLATGIGPDGGSNWQASDPDGANYAFADALDTDGNDLLGGDGRPDGGEFMIAARFGTSDSNPSSPSLGLGARVDHGLIHLGIGVEGYWDKTFTVGALELDETAMSSEQAAEAASDEPLDSTGEATSDPGVSPGTVTEPLIAFEAYGQTSGSYESDLSDSSDNLISAVSTDTAIEITVPTS
ncbi:MAG: LEPR-XLL domain-containing protein, partial [Planctomycetes bacterium]|nr:LEPR-XLL domain-containing protein [Planctomycetota bacterium]